MIYIHRPITEPAGLRQQRHSGLQRSFAALNLYGAESTQLKDALRDYDGGKASLFKAQHRKCAYCGRRVGFEGQPLEHFRPKRSAWRTLPEVSPVVRDPGYWWLTWEWSNQLFACATCNTGYKQNYFPLAAGSARLSGPEAPFPYKRLRAVHRDVSVETPLLVDPGSMDPLDHIKWCPVDQRKPKRLWIWGPKHLTTQGEVTIRVLRLKNLADDIADHLRDNVLARALAICTLVDEGSFEESRGNWIALGEDVARSHCVFAGPTWNALHYLVEKVRRTTAGLPDLPRP